MALQASDPRPILCAVLDSAALGGQPFARARALFEAGVDWIQLRERNLEGAALLCLARRLVEARGAIRSRSPDRHRAPRVIVNKRIDVALAAGADGVHLGLDALGAAEAAALLPDESLIGASCHSIDEVRAARAPLGYAHLAPIWDPRSKPASRPALGLEVLGQAAAIGLPLLAQGGLDPERAREAVAAGAAGVAVTGILGAGHDGEEAARRLRAALDAGLPRRG